ncbi:MAG: MBL fold metallo-hydrolase, partial [Blautia sp.]|nr:MBL fold metallo-hydrolase [Blautia sp.]
KLFGEEIQINAEILVLPGISGHADNNGLLKWAGSFQEKPKKVFVCHGDDESCQIFTNRLIDELHYDAYAPYSGTIYDLKKDVMVYEAEPKIIEKRSAKQAKASSVFQRLLTAGQRLLGIIHKYEGGANKDLSKFTDQINSLCDKWDF